MITEVPGYSFTDPSLLQEALTHPSLDTHKSRQQHYQRLEFLGDRVLGLVIADYLFKKFPNEQEGRLNRRLSALVRGATIAVVTERIGLNKLIHMTEGADIEGTRDKESVKADVGEAVIGAIYLDGGIDAARAYILAHWADLFDNPGDVSKDAKTALQEIVQKQGMPLPGYLEKGRTGPDHAPVFQVEVSIADGRRAVGEGSSKKIAAQDAARLLIDILEGK